MGILKMLPLIDGAEYKLFDTQMFSLTDGASNKLVGMKMGSPPPEEQLPERGFSCLPTVEIGMGCQLRERLLIAPLLEPDIVDHPDCQQFQITD